MIASRLFLKVYLTVLGCLALVVITLSALTFLGRLDPNRGPLEQGVGKLASSVLSADVPLAQRQSMLDRLSRAFDADIAIFDAKGRFVQGAGARIERPDADDPWIEKTDRFRAFRIDMPDGATLVAYVPRRFAPPRGHLVGLFLVTALMVGVGAYPVVRHLTRRLDHLRVSVDHWGNGDLTVRAPVHGRDEVAAVARTFNLAADRIEALVKSQKSLLANASHELRSPLARLRLAVEMQELARSDRTRDEIIRNLAELDDIVEEILLKSRLSGERPPPLDQSVDLLALASEEAAATGAGVEGDAGLIIGNEKLLRRLIRNLLQNAERHGAPPVTVTLAAEGDAAILRIRDHGPGIAPQDRERVFEPFYRPAGRSEADGGWGLGLSLVAEIARLHGGSVIIENVEGAGACILVRIAKGPSGRFL
ncbi:two-component system OmpR family sensor kinase [Rhizobium sp. SG_E_25_P2]|uniref:sensor histidine kinase n=1 Tax=Rhizobium sp. SG_E_25_P2 TaxID=2879942 RepID=UPI0024759DE7|nr:ATP-binding protein [Rhizobium sp. SG_E_25_P2]MDH6269818.1 two-component system OmpR family sensor kinase [Rhizobium sp. SG_E_25_P2]